MRMLSGERRMKVSERPTPTGRRTQHHMVEPTHSSMSRSSSRHQWIARSLVAAVAIVLWPLTSAKSGYTAAELLMFAGPGIVLTMAASWSARVFHRDEWTWAAGMRAILVGGLVSPPIIGLSIAFLAALNHEAVLLIFILGAWLALAGGVFVACVRALRDDFRKRQPVAPVHLVLLPPTEGRSRHRLHARAGRRPPWVEYRSTRQTPTSRQRPSA